jgi:hypothetical protein
MVRTSYAAGDMLMRDNKMYFWNKDMAYMMEFNPQEMMEQGEKASQNGQTNPEDTIEAMEKYKDSCRSASVPDSMFDLPEGVKFQDYSNMTKKMMPTGGAQGTPSIDPKQYEDLMKKYSNP